jgi:SAM-dependent methyltransferase
MTITEAVERLARLTGRVCRWTDQTRHDDVWAALKAAGMTLVEEDGGGDQWALTVLDTQSPETITTALARATASIVVLARVPPAVHQGASSPPGTPLRQALDLVAVVAGFRRHPLLFSAVDYAEIEHEDGWILVPLERIPEAVAERFPMRWLAEANDLHMDMTRSLGRRSDAHMARYAFASRHLPQTGRILDSACGLGYGSAQLAHHAPGRTVIGVDIDPTSVDYARANFGVKGRIEFETRDVVDLSGLPSRSIDAVASFETVEHVNDAQGFLRELRRVVKDDAPIVASVPYRWIFGKDDLGEDDLGPHHVDWYDVTKLIRLFSRFFLIDGLWRQTAGGGTFCVDAPRGWHRLDARGAEPTGTTEWLVIAARPLPLREQRSRPRTRREDEWIFLAPGVSQLATMVAAMRGRKIEPRQVTVLGLSSVADDGFDQVMTEAAETFGLRYAGNLFTAPDVTEIGDPLDYRPDVSTGRAAFGARIRKAWPILESLRGRRLMMPVRSDMTQDYAIVAAVEPVELQLVSDGIQNHVVVRDLRGAAGFADNELASLPTAADVRCPPWLSTETAGVGRPVVLPEASCRRVLAQFGRMSMVASLAEELSDRKAPFGGVIVSQSFASSALTSGDAEEMFHIHQIRALLARTKGRVLFKAHPRDSHAKLDAIMRGLGDAAARVRVTRGVENHVPLEAFPQLGSGAQTVHVWGTSSAALLGVRSWPKVRVSCVDADYVEAEIRRQGLQFAQRHAFPLITLRFDDVLLGRNDRLRLRRTLMPLAHYKASGLPQMEARVWLAHETLKDRHTFLKQRQATLTQQEATFEQQQATLGDRLDAAQRERDVLTARARAFSRLAAMVVGAQRPLTIWGAGAAGRRLRAVLPIPVLAFVDSDPSRSGTVIDGVPVTAPASLVEASSGDPFVVVASLYAAQISEALAGMGKRAGEDFAVVTLEDIEALEAVHASTLAPA